MDLLNTILTQTMLTASQAPAAPAKQDTDGKSTDFDALVREKRAGTAKEPPDARVEKEDQPAVQEKPEETGDVPAERLEMAAALMYQVRPDIQYVQPEEAPAEAAAPLVQTEEAVPVLEAPAEAAAPEAQQQGPIAVPEEAVKPETVPEEPKEAVQDAPEAAESAPQPQEEAVREEQPREAAERTEAPREESAEEDDPHVENAPVEKPVFGEMESAPLKVAEPQKAVEVETPQAPEQLARQITEAVNAGEGRVEVTLSPANLGRVTVELTRSGDGALSIVLSASTPKAAALLQQHADGLQNLLASSSRTDVHVEVRGSEEAPQQFLNPNGEDQNGRQQQRQQQEERRQRGDPQEFLQRLRLGLVELG